jgi:hypothetical protein
LLASASGDSYISPTFTVAFAKIKQRVDNR